jgi:hypothetical protein
MIRGGFAFWGFDITDQNSDSRIVYGNKRLNGRDSAVNPLEMFNPRTAAIVQEM